MIALLGASGRIGGEVYKALKRLSPDTAVRCGCRNAGGKNGEWQAVDIFDEDSMERFVRGADIIINAAGPSQKVSPGVLRAAVKNDKTLIDIGENRCFKDNTHSRDSRVIFGCGSVPGVSGLIPLGLSREFDKVRHLRMDYIINESLSYSAAFDMSQRLNPHKATGLGSKPEKVPFIGENVYRYRYFDDETAAVDRQIGVRRSEWSMIRESDSFEKLLCEEQADRVIFAEKLRRLGEVGMLGKQEAICFFAELTGERNGKNKTVSCFVKASPPSALSGKCTAAAALALMEDHSFRGACMAAEYSGYLRIWEKLIKAEAFDTFAKYPYSFADNDEEENGEL